MDVEFIGQLVDSMSEAVSRLESAISDGRYDEATKLKVFVLDLQKQIAEGVA